MHALLRNVRRSAWERKCIYEALRELAKTHSKYVERKRFAILGIDENYAGVEPDWRAFEYIGSLILVANAALQVPSILN